MATESDSVPEHEDRQEPPPSDPPGWRRVQPDVPVLRLDPSHPNYPRKWREDQASLERDFARLDRDPRARAAVGRVGATWAASLPEWLFLLQAAETAMMRQDATAMRGLDLRVRGLRDTIEMTLRTAAQEMGNTHIHVNVRARYLAERALPPTIAADFIAGGPPVDVLVNHIPERVAWTVRLQAGEILVKFVGTSRREFDKASPFVTEALEILGHTDHRDTGGRPAGETDDELAMTIAKLRHWDRWSHRKIAAFYGWLRDDEDWADEKVRRRIEMRVRRWSRRGESLLDKKAKDEKAKRGSTPWRERPHHMAPAAKDSER